MFTMVYNIFLYFKWNIYQLFLWAYEVEEVDYDGGNNHPTLLEKKKCQHVILNSLIMWLSAFFWTSHLRSKLLLLQFTLKYIVMLSFTNFYFFTLRIHNNRCQNIWETIRHLRILCCTLVSRSLNILNVQYVLNSFVLQAGEIWIWDIIIGSNESTYKIYSNLLLKYALWTGVVGAHLVGRCILCIFSSTLKKWAVFKIRMMQTTNNIVLLCWRTLMKF